MNSARHTRFVRTFAVTPGISSAWQPLHNVRLTEGSLLIDINICQKLNTYIRVVETYILVFVFCPMIFIDFT